ncbi:MAG TPA: IS200/IS605 family transposase [bacterium]|nr:IS200/IS605 family transposase [bacterium]
MSSTYSQLHFHVVFAVKDRLQRIDSLIQERLYQYIVGIVCNKNGIVHEMSGTQDHLHLLISLPPALSIADMIRFIKTNSSKWLHENFREMDCFAWQVGYSVFSVSHSNLEIVSRYIKNQKEHHRNISFQDELATILKKHNIVIKS